MVRVFGAVRSIGSLLAIEMFVPGGTLILLAIFLTSRPGSPLLRRIGGLHPALPRLLQRLASIGSNATRGIILGPNALRGRMPWNADR
jgi:hypothetical protein